MMLPVTRKKLVFLVSAAAALQALESLLPHPIPGIRFGLANAMSLLALADLGGKAAIEVSLYRILATSLILGTFLSPTFFLSFIPGIISITLTVLLYRLKTDKDKHLFSLTGVSIAGSICHILAQFILIITIFIPNSSMFYLLPWLLLSALITGWLNGKITAKAVSLLKNSKKKAVMIEAANFQDINNALSDANYKTSLVIALATAFMIWIILLKNTWYLTVLLGTLTLLSITFKNLFLKIIYRVWKLKTFLLLSFLFPLLLSSGGLHISKQALYLSNLILLRLLISLFISSFIMQLFSKEALAGGILVWLKPLSLVQINPANSAQIIVDTIYIFPSFLETTRIKIKKRLANSKSPKQFFNSSARLLAELYQSF